MKIIFIHFYCCFTFCYIQHVKLLKINHSAIKKENEKLSKFLQQPESELKIVMGEPDNVIKDDKGTFLIYTKKKYSITCERKFEIDKNKMVVGFTSKGCF